MPATLSYPGVYVEEIPSGVHAITGVPTSVTAFVGRARRGPVNSATVVNSFSDFGRVFGGLDFQNYFIMLGNPPAGYNGPMTYEALTKVGVPLLAYGNFITVVINFVILAFVIFIMVKQINRLKREAPPAPPAPPVPAEYPRPGSSERSASCGWRRSRPGPRRARRSGRARKY